MNNNRNLPKKEADLFKSVVKFYESKQYKKGIKAADNILKKFPNHGETLCMKGLTLNFMNRKEEAHEFVRKGLMNDMRSHVCWHVFGLLHRSDRNYNEAIKAYKQALRIDPDNLQILRDLSLLQIQMRDLHGFVKTRHTILNFKPNNKIHWLAFALSKNLVGDKEGALNVIDIYLGTLGENSPDKMRGFESGELSLYKNSLLEGRVALEHLEECKDLVVDVSAWMQGKGKIELGLGMWEEAKGSYLALMRRGETENYAIHNGYMCAVLQCPFVEVRAADTLATIKVLSSEERRRVLEGYERDVMPINPKSYAVRRIPLTLLDGEELRGAIGTYCRQSLQRGVPSLGSDLSALLLVEDGKGGLIRIKDPVDIKVHPTFIMITKLVDDYITSLEEKSCFPGEEVEQPPSTLLWTWYLRAYLYKLSGTYKSALILMDKCLDHTPTAVDVYELKARLLKLSGDISQAADVLDVGRELDKQDRYINNKTTKYMLQADREDVARERVALFTRHEGNPEQNLFDMQCTWYELELARSYARTGDWGKSLKKFLAIEKHFDDFNEDQFDFHSYCIRKVTLRAYVDVLRFEDTLHTQKYYRLASSGLITNYLHLHDNPQDAKPKPHNMTPAEKKKAAKRKKQQKNGKPLTKNQEFVELDPNGELLLKNDFLEEARKYVAILAAQAPMFVETWVLCYKVCIRRKKYSMALQALCKAKKIDEYDCDLFTCIHDFVTKFSQVPKDDLNPLVYETIQTETHQLLLDGKSLEEFISTRVQQVNQATDLLTRIAIFKVNGDASLLLDGLGGRKVTCHNCKLAWVCLKDAKVGEDVLKCWRDKVRDLFPFITLD